MRLDKRIRMGVMTFLWKSTLASLLVTSMIYSLFVQLILLDPWIWLYQAPFSSLVNSDKLPKSW
jgi:hypothetical protein